MTAYSDYGTGTEAKYIELIDRMLREKRDYISTEDVLKRYQEEYDSRISLKSSRNKTFDKAKGRIRKCLQARGLDFDERMINGKSKEFIYPEDVPEDLLSPLKKKDSETSSKDFGRFNSEVSRLVSCFLVGKVSASNRGRNK